MLNKVQKGSNVYAVVDMDNIGNNIDKVSILMINSNQNQNIGLAPIRFEEMNGIYEKMLFDVTGRVTLREHITKKISQDAFKQMLINLIETIEQFDEYMIDVNQIILDIDSVFINEVDNTVSFICIPIKDLKQQGKLYEFFKNIVETSYVEWNINEVSYFNGVYNIVKSENGFSLHNMKIAMKMQKENANEVDSGVSSQMKISSEPVNIEKKVEEPSTITVASPPPVSPVAPISVTPENQEKNKGILGKIFSSSKKKEKREKTNNNGYQGGLAGLKNGTNRKGVKLPGQNNQMSNQPFQNNQPSNNYMSNQPFQNNQPSNNYMSNQPFQSNQIPDNQMPNQSFQSNQIPDNQMPNQQFRNVQGNMNVHVQQNNDFIGTTALKSGMPKNNISSPVQTPPNQQQNFQTQLQNHAQNNVTDNNQKVSLFKTTFIPSEDSAPVSVQTGFAETTALKRQNVSMETTALKNNRSPETTALKSPVTVRAFLVRCKSRENIEIRKPIFFIGRDNPEQDYCINDNMAVGHKHAQIIRRGTSFVLMDLNSKNHTFINGNEIVPRTENKLNNGDKVTFADEDFEFRVI